MKRKEAIKWAEKIALLIHSGSDRVGRTTVKNQPLMGKLSIMLATQNGDVNALDPSIKEIILFGSAAQVADSEEVGDLDLMIFDTGFYSNILSVESGTDLSWDSGIKFLRDNLAQLFERWFGFSKDDPVIRELLETPLVDLHVLPITVFTDPRRQSEIAAKHHDPQFFENAFSSMLRFDRVDEKFVPVDLAYFEQRHSGYQIQTQC